MKRIVIWVLATLTVVVLLFGYRTSRQGALNAAPPAAVSGSLATSGATSGSTSGSTSGTTSGGSQSGKSSHSPSSKSSSAGKASSATTVTGQVAQTMWGPVEVRLTVQGGKVTDVAVPVYPSGTGRDYEINSYALPILVQETLKAQSAQIDMVSGATVTSGGYLQSLQSALDKAGL